MAEGRDTPLPITGTNTPAQTAPTMGQMYDQMNKLTDQMEKLTAWMSAQMSAQDKKVDEFINAQEIFKKDVTTFVGGGNVNLQQENPTRQPPVMDTTPPVTAPGFNPASDSKSFSQLVKSMPKYNPNKQRWPVFLRLFNVACLSEGLV